MKLDLLTNAAAVDDAIRFVEEKSKYKEKLKQPSSDNDNKGDKEESKEPDYNEDENQLEEVKQGQEIRTINQVF